MALKDITLGQYFPGTSLIHKLDPRTKILAVVLYIVALFLAKSFVTYLIMFGVLAVAVAVSKVPLRSLVRGMKPVVFILVFTAVINVFYTPGDHVLVKFWVLTVTMEWVWNAFFMVVRILMLISCTFLLTYTTSPIFHPVSYKPWHPATGLHRPKVSIRISPSSTNYDLNNELSCLSPTMTRALPGYR